MRKIKRERLFPSMTNPFRTIVNDYCSSQNGLHVMYSGDGNRLINSLRFRNGSKKFSGQTSTDTISWWLHTVCTRVWSTRPIVCMLRPVEQICSRTTWRLCWYPNSLIRWPYFLSSPSIPLSLTPFFKFTWHQSDSSNVRVTILNEIHIPVQKTQPSIFSTTRARRGTFADSRIAVFCRELYEIRQTRPAPCFGMYEDAVRIKAA